MYNTQVGLADITLRWCRGTKFADLMAKSEIFEGSVIRCIRRLEELVMELASVCKVCEGKKKKRRERERERERDRERETERERSERASERESLRKRARARSQRERARAKETERERECVCVCVRVRAREVIQNCMPVLQHW